MVDVKSTIDSLQRYSTMFHKFYHLLSTIGKHSLVSQMTVRNGDCVDTLKSITPVQIHTISATHTRLILIEKRK